MPARSAAFLRRSAMGKAYCIVDCAVHNACDCGLHGTNLHSVALTDLTRHHRRTSRGAPRPSRSIMSHGWNNDIADARALYAKVAASMRSIVNGDKVAGLAIRHRSVRPGT